MIRGCPEVQVRKKIFTQPLVVIVRGGRFAGDVYSTLMGIWIECRWHDSETRRASAVKAFGTGLVSHGVSISSLTVADFFTEFAHEFPRS